MAQYARVVNGIVTEVLVIDWETLQKGFWGDPSQFIQTSYNTFGGVYYIPNSNPRTPDPDQSKALRKNFAGIGFTYDRILDAFIPPKPYPSWILNEQTCLWEAPVPYPADGHLVDPSSDKYYYWDEATISWSLTD